MKNFRALFRSVNPSDYSAMKMPRHLVPLCWLLCLAPICSSLAAGPVGVTNAGGQAMIETFPLEKAAEAYEKMLTAKVHFRAVLKVS